MFIKQLRSQPVAPEIPAPLLPAKSNLECGYVRPTEQEFQGLNGALKQRTDAKAAIQEASAAVGRGTDKRKNLSARR